VVGGWGFFCVVCCGFVRVLAGKGATKKGKEKETGVCMAVFPFQIFRVGEKKIIVLDSCRGKEGGE